MSTWVRRTITVTIRETWTWVWENTPSVDRADDGVSSQNLDASRDLCVNPVVDLPAGWTYQWNVDFVACLTVAAGGSPSPILTVYPNWPQECSGSTAQVTIAFTENDEGAISDDDQSTINLRRPVASVEFDDRQPADTLRPSDSLTLTVHVLDNEDYPVADGTNVTINTDLGNLSPSTALVQAAADSAVVVTQNGRASVRFAAAGALGNALISASVLTYTDQITLGIAAPPPSRIELTATPSDLTGTPTSSALLVTVRDGWGNAAPNAAVRLGVSDDDGERGRIVGSEVITRTTDANGQIAVTFTKPAGAVESVSVRAKLLAGASVIAEDEVLLVLGASQAVPTPTPVPPSPGQRQVYLPVVRR